MMLIFDLDLISRKLQVNVLVKLRSLNLLYLLIFIWNPRVNTHTTHENFNVLNVVCAVCCVVRFGVH
jgi:hypothetical protein